MFEIASIILLVFASVALVFVITLLATLWFRERKLPPEEKEQRRKMRGGMDKSSLLFIFPGVVKLLIILFVILTSLGVTLRYQNTTETPPELQQINEEQTIREQVMTEPIDTSDWQTYRNDEFGFEVKYPTTWQVEEFSDLHLSYGTVLDSSGPQKDRLYIVPGGLSYTSIGNPEVVYQQEVLAGKQVRVQSIYQENNLIAKNIEVSLATGTYITIYTTPDSNGAFSNIDQILSTFQFIEPIDTSTWQTYRNEEFGFEIQYPNDWVLNTDRGEYGRIVSLSDPIRNEIREENMKLPEYEGGLRDVEIIHYKDLSAVPLQYKGILDATHTPQTLQDHVEKYYPAILNAKETVTAGYPSHEITSFGLDPYLSTWIISKDGVVFEIILSDALLDNPMTNIQKKILSTFRFIEQE